MTVAAHFLVRFAAAAYTDANRTAGVAVPILASALHSLVLCRRLSDLALWRRQKNVRRGGPQLMCFLGRIAKERDTTYDVASVDYSAMDRRNLFPKA